jgi:hypothetical protein
MSTLFFIGLVIVMVWAARSVLRHRSSLISVRGFGIRADIGRLNDVPRVRIQTLAAIGDQRTRLVVASSPEKVESGSVSDPVELTFIVELDEQDAGFAQLHEWLEGQADLGFVLPPAGRIVRLRSIEDLQPLTLRLVDP